MNIRWAILPSRMNWKGDGPASTDHEWNRGFLFNSMVVEGACDEILSG